jgi:hypothetical protein
VDAVVMARFDADRERQCVPVDLLALMGIQGKAVNARLIFPGPTDSLSLDPGPLQPRWPVL